MNFIWKSKLPLFFMILIIIICKAEFAIAN